jgi:hypothetical protein
MQIFRDAEKTPPSPAIPTVLSRRWDSSGFFQPEAVGLVVASAFEAVRIRGKSENFIVSMCFLW